MRIHVFEHARMLRGFCLLAGLIAGGSAALSAYAFTPMSGPLLSASSAPPNVVMLFDNSSSMVINRIQGDTRLDIARDVAKEVIADNRNVRFGLFAFRETQGSGSSRDAPGGRLRVEVGSIAAGTTAGIRHFEQLNDSLDALNPSRNTANLDALTWTPLAESYYEITRYMRGMRAFYPQTVREQDREQFRSPIQYRCQKNVGLILTDGLPTYDNQFPASLAEDPDGNNPDLPGSFNLPDWDGNPAGDIVSSNLASEGSTFYLDDIARFAHDTDMRTHADGTDLAGHSWDDPAFARQNLRTYTVGFALNDSRLEQTAHAGNGRYYTASNREELKNAMSLALQEIVASAGSGGGATVDAQVLHSGARYYQTLFDPKDWSGSLNAFALGADGQPARLLWSTDSSFTPTSRPGVFQTWDEVAGRVVALGANTYANLPVAQRSVIDAAAGQAGLSGPAAGQQLIDWARGVEVSGLRTRSRLLGDILHASPVLAVAGLSTGQVSPGYQNVKQQRMTESLIVGANDGFLRVFDTSGRHRMSFLPATLHAGLGARARPDYGNASHHRAGVDGRLALADVPLAGVWSTVAATGLGAGGQALIALRVFDEQAGDSALGSLWEVNAGQSGWEDLGYIYGRPVIAELHGRSVLITGNGYGSASGIAALMIIDLASGALLRQIDVPARTEENGGNGLSAATLHQGGWVFAGDLHGQLWKFDLTDSDPAGWSLAHSGSPLFTAAANQPITVAPQIHRSALAKGDLVLFGTGKLMEMDDLADTSEQAFYAVLDTHNLPAVGLTPANLQSQQIDTQSNGFRTLTQHSVDWSSQYGWQLPLSVNNRQTGERVFRDFSVRDGRVIFVTGFIEASNDPCLTQAGGWLMIASLDSGSMLPARVLDTNADGLVNLDDSLVAGQELAIGLPGDMNILTREEDPQAHQIGCADDLILVQGSEDVAVIGTTPDCRFDRIMWRQRM